MSYTAITKGNFRGIAAGSVIGKSPELQPNYSVEYDGYGLITGRATFVCTASAAKARTPKRGDVFPGTEKRLYCHRASYTINGNKLATITAEYVGIEDGKSTKMVLRGDTGVSTESIKSHPDFKKGKSTDLQNCGWDRTSQSFPEGPEGTMSQADHYALTGIKSFLRANIQIQGTFYTTSKELLTYYIAGVGRTFTSIKDADFSVYNGCYKKDSEYHDKPGMITSVSHEEFGNLFKISVSFRIAQGGWHKLIYKPAQ
jgi:hypothetical protein